MSHDEDVWADPDRAAQIEDDNPEALAGEEVEFNPDEDDDEAEREDFPSAPTSSDAGVENPPVEGA